MYVDTTLGRRTRDYTNLEMEAMVLVNEDVPGPRVTDEEKFADILASKKQRKAVSRELVKI